MRWGVRGELGSPRWRTAVRRSGRRGAAGVSAALGCGPRRLGCEAAPAMESAMIDPVAPRFVHLLRRRPAVLAAVLLSCGRPAAVQQENALGVDRQAINGVGCLIGGVMYENGTPNPANPTCQVCNTASSTTGWSVQNNGSLCGGPGHDAAPDVCCNGFCANVCWIGGQCWGNGVLEPPGVSSCRSCNTAVTNFSWTEWGNGTTCGSGELCWNGSCQAGCDIANTFYSPGQQPPSDPCEDCNPGYSTSSWDAEPNGTSCGGGASGWCVGAATCQNGSCACPGGTTYCNGQCVDLRVDSNNCGWCGNSCWWGGGCFGGSCTYASGSPYSAYWAAVSAGSDGLIHLMGGQDWGLYPYHVGYSPYSNGWYWLPGLPQAESDVPATLATNGSIYLFGGVNYVGNDAWSYQGWWSWLARYPHAMFGNALAAGLDGNVYSFGGWWGERFGWWDEVPYGEIYHPSGNWYREIGMLQRVATASATTARDGRIFVINGTTGWLNGWKGVQVYTPGAGWSWGPGTNIGRTMLASATNAYGQLMAIGGSTDYWWGMGPWVETSWPGGGWSYTSNLRESVTSINAAEGPDCRVYVVDGLSPWWVTNNTEVYDPRRGYWTW